MRFVCLTCVLLLPAGCGGEPANPSTAASGQSEHPDAATVAAPRDASASDVANAASGETRDAGTAEAEQPVKTVDPAFSGARLSDHGDVRLSAADWLARADDLIAARDFLGARDALDRALEADSDLVEAYVKRAGLLAQSGVPAEAIVDISAAIERRPNDPRLRNTRGYLYLSLNKYELATRDFNDAIGIDLEFAQPYNNRGLARIARGEFETALLDFDAALRLDPEYHDAHNNRGLALMQLERYTEAVESFTTAIDLNPDYAGGWNNRGLAHHRAGEHAAAIEDFSQAIERQPDSIKFWMHRSVARKAEEDAAGAEADAAHAVWLQTLSDLTRSIRQAPDDADRWVARGRHYLAGNKLEQALQDFNRAAILDVSCAAAYSGRAAVYLRQGDPERAVHECSRAIERAPLHEAYSVRGDAYFEQGDYDRAISDYSAARRLDPQVARAYLLRSQQREAAGEIEQASADYEQALSLDPELAEEAE